MNGQLETALILLLVGLGFVVLTALGLFFYVYQRTRQSRGAIANHHFDSQSKYSHNSVDFIRTHSPDPTSPISTTHHIHIGGPQSRPVFEAPPLRALPSPLSSSGSTVAAHEHDAGDVTSNAKSTETSGSLRSVVVVGDEEDDRPRSAGASPAIPPVVELPITRPLTAPLAKNDRFTVEMPEEPRQIRSADGRRAADLRLPTSGRMEKLPENENEQLYAEYEQLERQSVHKDATVGLTHMTRNRYHDVIPFDYNRVVLKGRPCDYINASYIRTAESGRVAYIAAQAPISEDEALGRNREATVADFWHMIWQEQVECIVTLTQCVEDMRTKCSRFWPLYVDEDERIDENLTMNMHELTEHDDICFEREIWLEKAGEGTRKVVQWQFKVWRDAAAPANQEHLLAFIEKVRSSNSHSPILVHCSAGVGRTGVYIALDQLLDKIDDESIVDVCEVVSKLREQRPRMVQNAEQYNSIYECVALAIRKRARTNG
ncbi:hypothetical protein M3Y99_00346600 [Aphelenchoides fujianensis]|nr:hypothetical protein M3Y99_00346600 [Aphelenchoides fujianensis]